MELRSNLVVVRLEQELPNLHITGEGYDQMHARSDLSPLQLSCWCSAETRKTSPPPCPEQSLSSRWEEGNLPARASRRGAPPPPPDRWGTGGRPRSCKHQRRGRSNDTIRSSTMSRPSVVRGVVRVKVTPVASQERTLNTEPHDLWNLASTNENERVLEPIQPHRTPISVLYQGEGGGGHYAW